MKGIIIAAGYGARCLPVTKTIPKEMLPLGCVPAIQFIVDEFIKSGISEIIIVSSRRKKALEDYFDREVELESVFFAEGKTSFLQKIKPPPVNIAFVHQQKMMGTGHALLQVKNLVGNSPCVVAYPDDLHMGERPLTGQLISEYEKTGCSVLASVEEPGDVSRYGVLSLSPDGKVSSIVEKPAPGSEPSHEISIGRFLFTPEFFDYIEEGWHLHVLKAESEARTPGEYYHIYALNKLMEAGKVVRKRIEGIRLDTGDPAGYLEAVLRYADTQPSLRPVLDRFFASRK